MSDPLTAYRTLLAKLDAFFDNALARYPEDIRCGPGCSDCCHRDLSLFPFELERLVKAARGLPTAARRRVAERARLAQSDEEAACPLLEDDRCLVYEARSVICRTHGLPSMFQVRPGQRELSLCPYNFKAVERVDGECVLDLDPVNQALATINHLICGQRGISPERQRISQALLAALDGADGGGGT